jgi:SAM-dependent methyltransferase
MPPVAGSAYYERAEQRLAHWWGPRYEFQPLLDRLNLDHVVDLACGHGRHTEQLRRIAGQVTAMDVLEENVAHCGRHFAADSKVTALRNNGVDFRPLADASVTAVVCYDAMVHFPPDVVASYVMDLARVLVPGGRALLQVRNLDAPETVEYGRNPHARNHMTPELLRRFAAEAGLTIEHLQKIGWGGPSGIPALDRVVLLQR